MPSAVAVFFGPENRSVTMKLLRYTAVMFTAPVLTFYAMFYFVFNQDKDMLGWCGIAAVVTTNIVIASYVIMAWNEPDPETEEERKARRNLIKTD